MSKSNKKAIPVYLITVILTLVLVGTTAIILFVKFSKNDNEKPTDNNASEVLQFSPGPEHNQNILFIYDSGSDINEVSFALVGFKPQEESLIFLPIPSNTFCQVNTSKASIYDYYKKEGNLKAVQAAEAALGIYIEKYAVLNRDGFNTLVNIFGGVTFSVPQDINYTNEKTGENTILYSGNQYMDGTILTKMMTYPMYPGGEEFRIKLSVNAVADMVNQTTSERLSNTLQNSFDKMINCIDTNISAFDFSFRKSSIEYVLDTTEEPASYLIPTGSLNENGLYVFDNNFLVTIKEKFTTLIEAENG